MPNPRFNRRQLLRRAGAGALGAAALTAVQTTAGLATDKTEPGAVIGSWDVTITPDPGEGPPFEQIFGFADGGLFTAASANSVPPGLGSWAKGDDGTFAFTFVRFRFDPAGKAAGKLKSNGQGSADVREDSIHGLVKADLFSLSATKVHSIRGTFRGRRLQVEPEAFTLVGSD